MFAITPKKERLPQEASNGILHDWDREEELNALPRLAESQDIHSLGELFLLNRIMHDYKERKGVRKEKADTRFLSA